MLYNAIKGLGQSKKNIMKKTMKHLLPFFLLLAAIITSGCDEDPFNGSYRDDSDDDSDSGGMIECTWCKGSGECHACDGDGLWLGNAKVCSYCDGDGICEHCDGSGVLEY